MGERRPYRHLPSLAGYLFCNSKRPGACCHDNCRNCLVYSGLLIVLNQSINRALEGYWPFGLRFRLRGREVARYKQLQALLDQVEDKFDHSSKSDEDYDELVDKRRMLHYELATRYPDEKQFILPTRFGNTIRAIERYPSVMYGADFVEVWPRLRAVTPADFLDEVDSSKSELDFWVNALVLSSLCAFEGFAVCLYSGQRLALLYVVAAGCVSVLSYRSARFAAERWGQFVKATYDVFLRELESKTGMSVQATQEIRRETWNNFSQAVTYRISSILPGHQGSDEQ